MRQAWVSECEEPGAETVRGGTVEARWRVSDDFGGDAEIGMETHGHDVLDAAPSAHGCHRQLGGLGFGQKQFVDRTHHIPQSRSGSFCALGALRSRVGREGRREIGCLTRDDCSAGEGHDESAEPDPRSSV
jgi:hypothetical protein